MNERILIVDDDPQITSFLGRYLKKEGFEPVCAATGREMNEILARDQIDLCVLDVGLPDADGFDLMRKLRRTSNLPIILLSIRDETVDRILGLEFGADDYVTKPFEPRELVARIRTVLRRSKMEWLSQQPAESGQTLLQFGPWIMNTGSRKLTNRETNDDADLTSMEFDILQALVEKPRTVLSRDQLLNLARGPSTYIGDRAIDVHIMRLRKKIEPDSSQPTFIKTIHGVGYCLAEDVSRFSKAV